MKNFPNPFADSSHTQAHVDVHFSFSLTKVLKIYTLYTLIFLKIYINLFISKSCIKLCVRFCD